MFDFTQAVVKFIVPVLIIALNVVSFPALF